MLCLVTPSFLDTLSNSCTIHFGKSTLTLFCSRPGLDAFCMSKEFSVIQVLPIE